MNRIVFVVVAGTAAVLSPIAAQADSASSSVTINGNVSKACLIGNPAITSLDLHSMTGSDGRLTTALRSATVAVSTTINSAWCNAPSTFSLNGEPLSLVSPPSYASPAGFSRLVTYNAVLTGWTATLTDRPKIGDAAKTTSSANPFASSGLTLNISSLEALNAAGTAETPGVVLEAGGYSAPIVISVAVQP